MSPTYLLLISHDPRCRKQLASVLSRDFPNLRAADCVEDAQMAILQQRPDMVLADLEVMGPQELFHITHQYALPVLCLHRVPDDELWTTAMDFGAFDLCCATDCKSIVMAIRRCLQARQSAA